MTTDVQFPKNKAGKCLLCNDELSVHDSKYLGVDGTIICTVHRVRDWQAADLNFKAYRYWAYDRG